jgi:hypothetical protein
LCSFLVIFFWTLSQFTVCTNYVKFVFIHISCYYILYSNTANHFFVVCLNVFCLFR